MKEFVCPATCELQREAPRGDIGIACAAMQMRRREMPNVSSIAWLLRHKSSERALEIPEDVVDAFQPDRQAHHVGRHAGLLLLLQVELAMRGGRGMDHERLRIPDV